MLWPKVRRTAFTTAVALGTMAATSCTTAELTQPSTGRTVEITVDCPTYSLLGGMAADSDLIVAGTVEAESAMWFDGMAYTVTSPAAPPAPIASRATEPMPRWVRAPHRSPSHRAS